MVYQFFKKEMERIFSYARHRRGANLEYGMVIFLSDKSKKSVIFFCV